jgi:hypothetical protein
MRGQGHRALRNFPEEKLMLTKTKLAAAGFAALAIGMTAFASAGEARTGYYYWGWGAPVSYASYVVPKGRHGVRVCRWFADYDNWGFYEGNNLVCSRHR